MSEPENAVELRDVSKAFGPVVAVREIDLEVPAGFLVTLLGPSGCGKTTTLRMIAGLEAPSRGDIYIKGRRINDVPIHKRNIGLVFQNYALFPHKTVFDNIAFGLKYRQVDKATIRAKVARALEVVRLPGVERRMPVQLSGGQQQRIALARAIVIEPDVLLLDEPLSALDAKLREEMRVELKKIQRDVDVTTIYVTHDQEEALTMSDRVVVMSEGRKEQEGAPEEVYNRPATRFVANFLGYSNFLDGIVAGREGGWIVIELGGGRILKVDSGGAMGQGARVQVVVRAEKVAVGRNHVEEPGATLFEGTVTTLDYLGVNARYFVDVAGLRIQAISPIDVHPFREGDKVQLRIRPHDCVLLDEGGTVHS